MRIYNKYILSLAIALLSTDILLSLSGQNDLFIYFTVNLVTYLVITLLYVYFNPRARRALQFITAVLLSGFIVIAILEVIEILLT